MKWIKNAIKENNGGSINWFKLYREMRKVTLYAPECCGRKSVLTDKEGRFYFQTFLDKPDVPVIAYAFADLVAEIDGKPVDLVVTISQKEPESLLLEGESRFIYLLIAITDWDKRRIEFH